MAARTDGIFHIIPLTGEMSTQFEGRRIIPLRPSFFLLVLLPASI